MDNWTKKILQWTIGSVLLISLAFAGVLSSCEVIAAGSGVNQNDTVWIRLAPTVAVEGKATLLLDFSKPIEGLATGASAAKLKELFTFANGEGTSGANEIVALSITKDSGAVYTLSVEHVPDAENGIILVTINKAGITPATRPWSLDGVVYDLLISRSDTDGILGAGSAYTCETVLGSFAPELGITLSNQGATPTGALNVALSGDDAGKFTLSSTSLDSIAAGGAVEKAFTVQPYAGLPLDSYSAVVTVRNNGIAERFTINYTVRLPYTAGASAPTNAGVVGEYVYSEFNAVAKDAEGCTYAVGGQWGIGVFSYGANVSATGSTDHGNAVIVKYDSAGEALWAKLAQDDFSWESSVFLGVATDAFGGVYAVGSADSSVIVKYKQNGEVEWANSLANDEGQFQAVAADALGNVYAVGLQFGWGTHNYGGNVTASSTGMNGGAVIVKYKSDTGTALWASSPSVDDGDTMLNRTNFSGVVTDALGNVYVAGEQDGTYTYEYGGASATGVRAGQFGLNAVLVKYDGKSADCSALWAKTVVSGGGHSNFTAIAIDGLGNLYAAGTQSGNGTFNYGGPSASGGASGWANNAVLVKYDSSNGAALWAKSVNGGNNKSEFYGVAADALGNVYAVGCQSGNSSFDYGAASTAGSYNYDTSVIVKYDSAGGDEAAVWAHAVQGNAFSRLYGIAGDGQSGFCAVGNQSAGTNDYGNGTPITAIGESGNAVVVGYR